ncbi:MAG: hypothetical protein JSV31_16625 [Desulfobacterales bacterium]|nr:MAG: hypothetical protein JSV31_16625 [Desulfobacterales bacterium]
MGFRRGKLFLLLFMLNMLLVACSTPAELEGTWIGYQIGDPHLDWILTIQHNQFNMICEDLSMWYSGHLKLNNNCERNKINLEIKNTAVAAYNGKTLFGIYKVEEDTLILVANEAGKDARPLSFDDETAEIVTFVLEKSKGD